MLSVFVWTGKNDSTTLRVGAFSFVNKHPDTCGLGLKPAISLPEYAVYVLMEGKI